MSGLITAAIIAGGATIGAGVMANNASKDAASAMRDGVQTFDPIEPEAPQTVDWQRVVSDALGFNLNNSAQRHDLANLTNRFNTRQAQKMYRTFQPSFDSLQSQIGQNALSFSRGQLPPDVVASIGRAAASRGLARGFGQGSGGGGSGTSMGALTLRNLGLTSLDLSKFGTNLAMNASLQAKQLSPALFDPASLMVSPNQSVGYEFQNTGIQNDAARYWNQLQNNALMQNTGAQNTANTNAVNTQLAGQLAQSQAIAAAGQTAGGVMGNYATNQQGYIPQTSGAPSGGAVPGYGYNPASGYYQLA